MALEMWKAGPKPLRERWGAQSGWSEDGTGFVFPF